MMRSESWFMALEVWDEVKGLEPPAVARLLSRAFPGRPREQEEIAALLAHRVEADPFLETPALVELEEWAASGDLEVPASLEPDGTDWAGQRLGPFVLDREIGCGGMGRVWRAHRVDGDFPQAVAVKFLHPRWLSTRFEERFLAERRILAGLDHPNICRLLEGGTTATGLAYLVMDLVEGSPLTDYCAGQRLALAPRLELFRTICSAVQHAHSALVVHRDLKPSNILVTAGGIPKLVDFGIAKLLAPEDAGEAATATEDRALTPAYASPEQLLGGRVTTASDVFSLGVLLYRLLTGDRPFDWFGKTPLEIERSLAGAGPPPPSACIPAPGLFRRDLTEDLDRIVLKALHGDPRERYPSAGFLAEDLARLLAGMPVSARRSSAGYRLRKFIARNPLAVTLAGLLAASLLVFAIAAHLQAGRLARQRDEAERQRASAEEVAAFLEDAFKRADPTQAEGAAASVRELIDRQKRRLLTELQDQPVLKARLLTSLGRVYVNLGLYQESLELFEEGLRLRQEVEGGEPLEIAESRLLVGSTRTQLNDFAGAGPLLEQALATQRAGLPAGDLRIALTLDHMGIRFQALEHFEAAALAFQESLDLRRRALGNDHELVSDSLHSLAEVARLRGDFATAETLARESLRIVEVAYGLDALQASERLYLLGAVFFAQGEYARAQVEQQRALEISRLHLGADHPSTATILGNLAVTRLNLGDLEGAEEALRETHRIYRLTFGDRHARTATMLHNLGSVQLRRGDLAGAEETLREALATKRAALGDQHTSVAATAGQLAVVLRKRGDGAGSESLARQALAIQRGSLGEASPSLVSTLTILGRALGQQGANGDAEAVFREALEIASKALPPRHLDTLYAQRGLAEVLFAARRLAEAEALYRQVLAQHGQSVGEDHPQTGGIRRDLAEVLLAEGDLDAAATELDAAEAVLAQTLPSDDADRCIARSLRGALLAARGESPEAEALLLESHRQLRALSGDGSPQTLEAARRIAEAYEAWHRPEQARRYRRGR